MMRVTRKSEAVMLARVAEVYKFTGFGTFDGLWYIGTREELEHIGCNAIERQNLEDAE